MHTAALGRNSGCGPAASCSPAADQCKRFLPGTAAAYRLVSLIRSISFRCEVLNTPDYLQRSEVREVGLLPLVGSRSEKCRWFSLRKPYGTAHSEGPRLASPIHLLAVSGFPASKRGRTDPKNPAGPASARLGSGSHLGNGIVAVTSLFLLTLLWRFAQCGTSS
jgi:hypothetical protein